MQLTIEEIEAARTPKGGWTRATLAKWGVSWPPPHGWKQALLSGAPVPEGPRDTVETSPIRPAVSAHDLLRQVVLAVIDKGHASDLFAFPDVLAYFGSEAPEDTEGLYGPSTENFFNRPLTDLDLGATPTSNGGGS